MPLWVLRSFVASTPNGVTPESATADELGWISIESPRERHYAAASRETSSVTCDGAGATGGTLRPIKGREDTRSNRCAAAAADRRIDRAQRPWPLMTAVGGRCAPCPLM